MKEEDDWGRVEHLLAALIDVTQYWGWAQLGTNKVPQPDPLPRPSDRPARTELSGPDLDDRLRRQMRRG